MRRPKPRLGLFLALLLLLTALRPLSTSLRLTGLTGGDRERGLPAMYPEALDQSGPLSGLAEWSRWAACNARCSEPRWFSEEWAAAMRQSQEKDTCGWLAKQNTSTWRSLGSGYWRRVYRVEKSYRPERMLEGGQSPQSVVRKVREVAVKVMRSRHGRESAWGSAPSSWRGMGAMAEHNLRRHVRGRPPPPSLTLDS